MRIGFSLLKTPQRRDLVSYRGGMQVRRGLKGSVRLDVVEGKIASPIAVYDFKFGKRGLTPGRIARIRQQAGLGNGVPVHEVRP